MNLEKFTIKSQEAIQMAQQIALGNQNQSIEAVHLLKAIAQVDQDVYPYIISKTGANAERISTSIG